MIAVVRLEGVIALLTFCLLLTRLPEVGALGTEKEEMDPFGRPARQAGQGPRSAVMASSALFALAALLIGLCGCATVMTGTTQNIRLRSTPSDATARIIGGASVRTPGEIKLARGNSYAVLFEKTGYQSAKARISQRTNGWTWLNFPFGGFILGMTVDSWTGAMYYLEPETVAVTLEPDPAALGARPSSVLPGSASPPATP